MARKPQASSEVVELTAVVEGRDIVRSRQTHDIVARSLKQYGTYVIEDRALPRVFDGLKPSQRRLLWTLHELKATSGSIPKKGARIVGQCFVAGTLVHSARGLVPIETLEIGDQLVKPGSMGFTTVTDLFHNPPGKILDVVLFNGVVLKVTTDQQFMVLDDDLTIRWVEAKDLAGCLVLATGQTSRNRPSTKVSERKLLKAYSCGLLVAEGSISDRGKSCRVTIGMTDRPPLDALCTYFSSKGATISAYTRKPRKKHWLPQFIVRFNARPDHLRWAYDICEPLCPAKYTPDWVLCDSKFYASYMAGIIDGDGHIRKKQREIVVVSTSPKLISQLQSICAYVGIHGNITTIQSTLPNEGNRFILGFSGSNASLLAEFIQPFLRGRKKRSAAKILISWAKSRRCLNAASESIPGAAIFREMSKHHIGAGWYQDKSGAKFRSGIKYPNGSKIRYAKNLRTDCFLSYRQLDTLGILKKLERMGSGLSSKLSQLIQHFNVLRVASVIDRGEHAETFDVQVSGKEHAFFVSGCAVHNCIGKYHPHGDSAAYGALVKMSWLHQPLVERLSNFGNEHALCEAEAASQRYCVVGSIRMRLADGTTPTIVSLVPDTGPNSTTSINLSVLDGLGRSVKATRFFHSGNHPTRTIKTDIGLELTGTLNHPVLCLIKDDNGRPRLKWILLSEVTRGTVVCVSRAYQEKQNIPPSKSERQLGILAGMMVSEGWVSKKRAGFNNTDKEFFTLALDAYRDIIGGSCYSYERDIASGSHMYEVDIQYMDHFASSPLADMIGQRSAQKRIPRAIWEAGLPTKRSFLQAVFEGDGNIHSRTSRRTKSIVISYSTRSKLLAKDLQLLLLEFGLVARIHKSGSKRGKDFEYTVVFNNKHSVRRFVDRVGFLTHKQKLAALLLKDFSPIPSRYVTSSDSIPYLTKYVRSAEGGDRQWLTHHNFDRYERIDHLGDELYSKLGTKLSTELRPLIECGFFYSTVVSARRGKTEPVYSVRVATDDHSFLVGGFVNHNTETRLSPLADHLFDDIDVVPLVANYDNTEKEPPILPARVPMLLVNGCSGIALAIATDIPPHNLNEVITACQHYLDHPDTSTADLSKCLRGPDYGEHSGVLLSTRKELSAFYRIGQGRLNFDCVYRIEEGRRSNKLVIIGRAPGLNKGRLLSVTQELAKNKLLVAPVYDDGTIEHPVRYVIEFTDYGIIKDRVLPLLKSAQSYRFYALDAANKPTRYDLLGIIKSFVGFRRAVEKKVLQRQREDLEKKLGTEQARLVAIQNLDWVVETLRSKSAEEAIAKLTKRLKLEVWQAEVILNSQLRSLMTLNEDAVMARITKLEQELAEVVKDLGQIDVVVSRRLEEMRKFSQPRGTLAGKAAALAQLDLSSSTASSFIYVGVTAKGGFERLGELPLKSKAAWPYIDLLPAMEQLVVVTDANKVQVVSLNYLDQFNAAGAAVVGVTSAQGVTVAISRDGHYVAFRPSAAAFKKAVPVFRAATSPLVRAVGLGAKDQLVIRFASGESARYTLEDFRVTRPNVASRSFGLKGEVESVLVLRRGQSLIDETGSELTDAETLPKKRRLFAVGKRNVVAVKGSRMVKGAEQLLDLLEKNGKAVDAVVPVPRKEEKTGSDA